MDTTHRSAFRAPAGAVSDTSAEEARILAAIDDALARGARLEALDDARFLTAHNAFEAASDQRRQIAAWLGDWNRVPAGGRLRMLSIGCGGGDLDREVAERLAHRLGGISYVGVDPNPVECARCVSLFADLAPRVDAEVHARTFESYDGPEGSFDLVHAVHILYYLPNVPRALHRARRLLRRDGALVVFHAPKGKLNALADRFWTARLGRKVRYSEDLIPELEGISHRSFRIEAELDVTACVTKTDPALGNDIRDFTLQLDGRALDVSLQRQVDDYFAAIARRRGDRFFAPHPVDVFVLSAEA